MSSDGVGVQYPGEREFRHYDETLQPDQVIFPEETRAGDRRYGVMVHRPAWQGKIVAVESGHPRHVAFISTSYCLQQVLELARGMARGALVPAL
jgi:hypothetical protein